MKFLLAFFFLFSIPVILFSQEDIPLDTLSGLQLGRELAPVTVTAYRLKSLETEVPLAVSRIGKFRLQRGEQQLTLNDAIISLPGVYVQNSENFAQDLRVSIRGFGSRANFGIRGVKVLQDGFPETTPDGTGQVDNIDPGSVQSVDVIRGATAGLYGNASGGYMDFTTLEFSNRTFVEGGIRVGSFGFQKYHLKTGGKLGRAKYSLFGSHLSRDGYREHSETSNFLFNGGVSVPIDSSFNLTVALNYVNSPTANDPGGLTLEEAESDPTKVRDGYVDQLVGEEVKQGRLGIFLEKKLSDSNQLSVRSWYTQRDFDNNLSFAIGELDRKFWGSQLVWEHRNRLLGRPWSFSFGTELEQQNDLRKRWANENGERGEPSLDRDDIFTNWGSYFAQKWQMFKQVNLHGSLRLDQVFIKMDDPLRSMSQGTEVKDERTYTLWNPMVGTTFNFSPQLNVYLNYATAVETPTMRELLDLSGAVFIENLVPQKSKSLEFGAKGSLREQRVRYELAIFRIKSDNEILPFFDVASASVYYRNLGKTERNGLEVGLSARLAKDFYGYLSYTFSDFLFVNDTMEFSSLPTGTHLPGLPRHNLYSELRYQPSLGFFGSVKTQFVGEQFADNQNVARVEPYWLANFRVGYAWEKDWFRSELFFGLNNVFDQFYFSNLRINDGGMRYFEPAPGRNFVVGITVRLN